MLDYLQTIFDAVFFAFALAAMPLALIVLFFDQTAVGAVVAMGFPLCWTRPRA